MEEKKRHIELAVVGVFGDQVTFRIAEQTHRKECFTPNGGTFKSYLGHYLMSIASPCYEQKNNTLCVRGLDLEKDERCLTVSTLQFAQIMEAINEYNETNGAGYEKPWPQAGDEFYSVEADGSVKKDTFKSIYDYYRSMCKIGNCFKTESEAKEMAEKFKSMLKGE